MTSDNSVRDPASEAQGLEILFIVGWERSGSTLLSSLLGSFPGVFNAGEVHQLWNVGSEARKCSCGVIPEACPFWSEVLQAVAGKRRVSDLVRDAARMRAAVSRTTNVFRGFRHARIREPSDVHAYVDLTKALYEEIGRRARTRVVIDSSKAPSFALVGARTGHPAGFLHLVRDPRAIAHSWTRSSLGSLSRSVTYSTSRWLIWNLAAERLKRTTPSKWMNLRYEDFVASPQETLSRALQLSGEKGGEASSSTNRFLIPAGHALGGNPRVVSGEIEVMEDSEWRRDIDLGDRMISTALGVPLLRRYGYPVVKIR